MNITINKQYNLSTNKQVSCNNEDNDLCIFIMNP
jgi:hypothetical protein